MEYRVLGTTGIKVSQLCFGVLSFGKTADKAASAAMFARCRDIGINFFDAANVYAGGRSEEILGDLITGCRDEVIITSKVASPTGGGANERGASRRYITMQVEASLKRLKTDRIDIYFVHHFDYDTPLEETLRALDDLVHQGKILHPAASNWAAWQVMKGLGIADRLGLARLACIQPMYNLTKRQAEVEILPMAQAEGLGVISYGPLGGGLLAGRYSTTEKPADGRLVVDSEYIVRYGEAMYYEAAERFSAYAAKHGIHSATLAVAWVMAHPAITAPIIGARNVEQLEASLAALDVDMTDDWYQEISALTPTPPPANDRTEEQTNES